MGNVDAMSTLMKKLTELAQSPQGKKLTHKAQQFANDPKTKAQVEKAKLKLAEMRSGGSTGGRAAPQSPTHPTTRRPPEHPSRGAPAVRGRATQRGRARRARRNIAPVGASQPSCSDSSP